MQRGLKLRNVKISGRRTSLRLEPVYWECLDEIVAREGYTLAELLTDLERRMQRLRLDDMNMHSAVRVFCVGYFHLAVTRSGHCVDREGGRDIFTGTPFELAGGVAA